MTIDLRQWMREGGFTKRQASLLKNQIDAAGSGGGGGGGESSGGAALTSYGALPVVDIKPVPLYVAYGLNVRAQAYLFVVPQGWGDTVPVPTPPAETFLFGGNPTPVAQVTVSFGSVYPSLTSPEPDSRDIDTVRDIGKLATLIVTTFDEVSYPDGAGAYVVAQMPETCLWPAAQPLLDVNENKMAPFLFDAGLDDQPAVPVEVPEPYDGVVHLVDDATLLARAGVPLGFRLGYVGLGDSRTPTATSECSVTVQTFGDVDESITAKWAAGAAIGVDPATVFVYKVNGSNTAVDNLTVLEVDTATDLTRPIKVKTGQKTPVSILVDLSFTLPGS